MPSRHRSPLPAPRHAGLIALGAALALAGAGCGSSGDPGPADSAAGSVDPAAVAAAPATAPLGDTAVQPAPAASTPASATPRQGPVPQGPVQQAPIQQPPVTPVPAPQPPARQAQRAQKATVAPQPSSPTVAPQQPAQAAGAAPVATDAPTASAAPASAPASDAAPARTSAPARASVPFAPGERYVYDVKFGAVDVGDGVMEVLGIEEVRGREAYHVLFRVSGGTMFYKVRDRYESWMDTQTLASLRHIQDIDEGSYERTRHFEIFPERGVYRENEKPETPTVEMPLDDGSFFFFVRTVPLEVGKSYEFNRYFKPDRNPVKITVLRRERVKVPAGTFDAVVVQPTIKTKGVFGEGGRAEIWIADDSTRAMLQMKSKLKFGSLNLYLKSVRPAAR